MVSPGTDQPNVLVIMSDQHNATVMGCAGDPLVETPHLDALAERGVVLSNTYCQSPLCAPSRMSFLTGMLPSANGVLTNDQLPSPKHPTFAHSAGAAGYRPYLVGKMHALGPDQLLGFTDRAVGDHGPNFPGGSNPRRGPLAGAMGPNASSLVKSGIGQNAYEIRDEYAVMAATDFLRRHAIEDRAVGARAPFFLSVGLMLPHQPYVCRAADFARYSGRITMPRVPGPTTETDNHPFFRWWRGATGIERDIPEQVIGRAHGLMGDGHRLDALIGELLDTLAQLGWPRTPSSFTPPDDGDHLGEHGLWWKQTLLDPAAKVPCIISWPNVIPTGGRSDAVCGLVDVNATIVAAAGGPPLPEAIGVDLVPMLTGTDTHWADTTISEHCVDKGLHGGLGPAQVSVPYYQRMIRRGRYKYIDYGEHAPAQLFDLIADPDEAVDRLNDPELAEVAGTLRTVVRNGWNPAQVQEATRRDLAEMAVIKDWAAATRPSDQHRWAMSAEYNRLDDDPSDLGPPRAQPALDTAPDTAPGTAPDTALAQRPPTE